MPHRLLTISLVFVLGCSVGPDYTPPELQLPQSFQQQKLPSQADIATYWKAFKDPVLDRLIDKGVAENLYLQEVYLRLKESGLRYGRQRLEFLPETTLAVEVERRRRSEGVASAISNPKNDYLSAGGALGWEIDILGRLRRLAESKRAEHQASAEEYFGALVLLQANIASSYVRLQTLKAEITLTRENIQRQQESLALAKDRYEAGIAPELDLRQAESNLGETQSTLPLLYQALSNEFNSLAVLIGRYPQELEEVISDSAGIPSLPELDDKKLPLNLVRQRPDIRRAERQLAAQHALIGVAQANHFPILSLPGFFSFEALNSLDDAFLSSSLAYSIGPRIDLRFLDFGRVRKEVKIERLKTEQLVRAYKGHVLEAVAEVETAMVKFNQEQKRVKHLTDSVKASKRSTELVKSLYRSGLTDFQNVLDSERTLFTQEIALTESVGKGVEAYIELFKALGGGDKSVATIGGDTA